MSILVIGTSGQLATELHRQAAALGTPLLAPVKLDLTDSPRLLAELDARRPRVILNAAAYTAVDKAETERERAFAVNATGPGALATWCAEHDACLVHVSTDYVFDGTKAAAYVEADSTNP